MVFRDANGYYLGAGQSRGIVCKPSLEAVLQALLMAVQHAWSYGYQQSIFEGDNMTICKLLNDGLLNFAIHNWVRDIKLWQRKFKDTRICWISRKRNKVADRLTQEPLHTTCNFIFHLYAPVCITTFLQDKQSG